MRRRCCAAPSSARQNWDVGRHSSSPQEFEMLPVKAYRDFYANYLVKSEGSSNQELIAAFASVERERFVGKGPWPVFVGSGYIPTISADQIGRASCRERV